MPLRERMTALVNQSSKFTEFLLPSGGYKEVLDPVFPSKELTSRLGTSDGKESFVFCSSLYPPTWSAVFIEHILAVQQLFAK